MTYDNDSQFNENNVTHFLSEIEEYVTHLITYLAHREKNADAPISALALENVAEKEFDKGPLTINAGTV